MGKHTKRPPGWKASRAASRPPRSIGSRTPAGREERDNWDEFEETLAREFSRRRLSEDEFKRSPAQRGGPPPYDKSWSYLKREVYRYVVGRLADGRGRELHDCIEDVREGRVPTGPSFRDNEFHWALLGLQRNPAINLKDYDVCRFGRQLRYARDHNVPPDLLIGFIYQTGGPEVISRKYAGAEREPWIGSLSALQQP